MSAFAIYIPSVYNNITAAMVAATFYRMKIGSVKHVEFIKVSEKHNRAYVFFESMYPFGKGAEMMTDVAEGKPVKLHYSNNEHVFWVMLKCNRQYDGVSKNGWFDPELNENVKDEKPKSDQEYTEEQKSFVPEPAFDLVSSDYALVLEQQLSQLRNENMHLRQNAHQMFHHMNHLQSQVNQSRHHIQDNHNMFDEGE